jgi:3-methyl-2-oxobutanoate hydroxymethyltransferase
MRVSIHDLRAMKQRGGKIPVLTAYDHPSARLADEAGIPVLLVGDSLGMVVLGYDSTVPVTMDDMVRATQAVVRGARKALIVADMPFMSYRINEDETVRNASRLIQDGGAQAVKLEGAQSTAVVRRLVEGGIPVMGHIGLTPQSVHQLGGYRVVGRSRAVAERLIDEARALEEAGVFALVLEAIPAPLAKLITEGCAAPTIGIGAGPHCDGQVQVWHDILGLFPGFTPKHTRRYADLDAVVREALDRFAADVRGGAFPTERESFALEESVLRDLHRPPDKDE